MDTVARSSLLYFKGFSSLRLLTMALACMDAIEKQLSVEGSRH